MRIAALPAIQQLLQSWDTLAASTSTSPWEAGYRLSSANAAKELRGAIAIQEAAQLVDPCGSGYANAFYEIASMLGISARADTPENVFRKEMLPKIKALVAGVAAPAVKGVERDRLRQVLGEVLSGALAGMCEDDLAPDWHDSRHIDELLDELMPVIRVHFDPELNDPSWSTLHPKVDS